MRINKPLAGLLAASVLMLGILFLASQQDADEEEDEEGNDGDEGGEFDINATGEAIRKEDNDEKDPLVMPKHAAALCQTAAQHRAKGEGNQAASCYLRALKLLEATIGPAHVHNATVTSNEFVANSLDCSDSS